MEKSQSLLRFNNKTGNFDIDTDKAFEYLQRYTPGYRISSSIHFLMILADWKEDALNRNEYDKEYEATLVNMFTKHLYRDASRSYQIVSQEELERHLTLATQYIQAIGNAGTNEVTTL